MRKPFGVCAAWSPAARRLRRSKGSAAHVRRGRPTLRGWGGAFGLAGLPFATFVGACGFAGPLAFRVGRRPRPSRKRGARLPPPRRSLKAAQPARRPHSLRFRPTGAAANPARKPCPMPLCRPEGRWAAADTRPVGGLTPRGPPAPLISGGCPRCPPLMRGEG